MFVVGLPILFQGNIWLLGLVSILWLGLLLELWWVAKPTPPQTRLTLCAVGLLVLVYTFLFLLQLGYVFRASSVVVFLFFFLPAVWMTDSMAYVMGRWLQGPRLAPKISPKKTWSGVFFGVFFGTLWGVGYLWFYQVLSTIGLFIAFSVPVVVVLGDLVESWVKRCVNTKDSSNLIPGHGGLWDRLDGVIAVLLWLFVLSMLCPQTFIAFLRDFS
ncbi:MAG: phosphatidate cytidylyltransferase [Holosporaceae bacterium]